MEAAIDSHQAPFLAPNSVDSVSRPNLPWAGSWTAVFAANLLIPLLYSPHVLGTGGELGAALGTCLIFSVSILIQSQFPETICIMQRGGIAVAVSQLIPVVQIFSGMFAIGFAEHYGVLAPLTSEQIEIDRICDPMGVGSAFVVSFLTGVCVLVVAAFAGVAATELLNESN